MDFASLHVVALAAGEVIAGVEVRDAKSATAMRIAGLGAELRYIRLLVGRR